MGNTQIEGEFEESETEQNRGIPKRPPLIETKISKSKDGKWLIHRTIITDIKSVAYFEQVLEGKRFDTHRVR